MSTVFSGVHSVAQTVALGRLRASRGHECGRSAEAPDATGFADTVPLWFRSEAFAEDVSDQLMHGAGQELARRADSLVPVDRRVLAAGAAIVRQTLQAFKRQRW